MKKYQVMAGEVIAFRVAECNTYQEALIKAKRYFMCHTEVPSVYLSEDCIQGKWNEHNFSGIYPKENVTPVIWYSENKGKWIVDKEAIAKAQ